MVPVYGDGFIVLGVDMMNAISSILEAVVLHCPQATGESWILNEGGQLRYVQIFERMDLIKEATDD